MDTAQRYKLAQEKFFSHNPHIVLELDSLNAAEADAIGVDIEEFKKQRRDELFVRAACDRDLDVSEFVIQIVAESPEQANAWRLEGHRLQADILGIDWSEYKTLNRIAE
ncbi:DUF6388 family protein (plasmid) [Pseudomonas mandelii]|uniref:DUF6388 family protein n=1 Tax=Pseudomonas mandelii TaxID=75612 RepID=UPI00398C9365